MAIPGTVPISAPVAPTSDLDTFPSHLPKYGKGGLRTVATIVERDAIPTARREAGMRVYVVAERKYYQIAGDLLAWVDTSPLDALHVGSVADLRANTELFPDKTQAWTVATSTTPLAGSGRHYWMNEADTTAADDGSTVIVDGSGQRWYWLTDAYELSTAFTLGIRNLTANNFARPGMVIISAGRAAAGDGGENRFYYDAADTITADNGGSVIVDTINRRWKQVAQTVFNVRQWGAKGDGLAITDDKPAIQAAADAARTAGAILHFPKGNYMIKSTVAIRCDVTSVKDARIVTDQHITAVEIGPTDIAAPGGVRDTNYRIDLPFVELLTSGFDFHATMSTGIRIGRITQSLLRFKGTDRFTQGILIDAPANNWNEGGCAWNTFQLGLHRSHKVGLLIYPGQFGWVTQSIFMGGEFSTGSAISGSERAAGYSAIRLRPGTGATGTGTPVDNHLFLNVSLENNGWQYMLDADCTNCRFIGTRFETGTAVQSYVRFLNTLGTLVCSGNVVDEAFCEPSPLVVTEDGGGTGFPTAYCSDNEANPATYGRVIRRYGVLDQRGVLKLQNTSTASPGCVLSIYKRGEDMDTTNYSAVVTDESFGIKQTPTSTHPGGRLADRKLAFSDGVALDDVKLERGSAAGQLSIRGAASVYDNCISLTNSPPQITYPFHFSINGGVNRYLYMVNANTAVASEMGMLFGSGPSTGFAGSANDVVATTLMRGRVCLSTKSAGTLGYSGLYLGANFSGQTIDFVAGGTGVANRCAQMDGQDTTTDVTQTGFLLRNNNTLHRVRVGAAGSGPGGSGRVLYIGEVLPQPLSLVATPGAGEVSLTWGSVAGATGYSVFFGTITGGPYVLVASGIGASAYTHTGRTPGTICYYVVSAQSAAGSSPVSGQASATPT